MAEGIASDTSAKAKPHPQAVTTVPLARGPNAYARISELQPSCKATRGEISEIQPPRRATKGKISKFQSPLKQPSCNEQPKAGFQSSNRPND